MPTAAPLESTDDLTAFLLELAAAMHHSQLPSDRIEEQLDRIGMRFGAKVDPLVLQGAVAMETRRGAQSSIAIRRIDFDAGWHLERVKQLVELARSVGEGHMSLAHARARLAAIRAEPPIYPRVVVVAGYSVYAAAVAARVGGGVLEVGVAVLLGIAAAVIHIETAHHRRIDLVQSFLAGAVGTALALMLTLVLPPFDLPRALFGGVSLLVPAMVIAIGTHELASGSLDAGVARVAYGILRFTMLGAGILAVYKLWGIFAEVPVSHDATPLPALAVLAVIIVGGAALTFCLEARLRDVVWMVAGALVAYGAQVLARDFLKTDDGAPALAAFILGSVAYLQARITGGVPFTMIIPGLLQLAPGFLGTQSVFSVLAGHPTSAGGFRVILVAVQLVLGLVVASAIFSHSGSRAKARDLPARRPIDTSRPLTQ